MDALFLGLRSLLFYICYVSFTTVFSLITITFIWFLPFKTQIKHICRWNQVVLFFARIILGIRIKIEGLENLPKDQPVVILANHQSQLETFLFLLVFSPVSIVLKKELLNIPGFGWGLRFLKPIAIDRSNPRQALRSIQSMGVERLQKDNFNVLIFPEGTRITPGVDKPAKYARSGAALAIAAGAPIVFAAHNASTVWPSDKFLKYPGTMSLFISEPIDTEGKDAKEVTEQAQQWINSRILEKA